MGEPGEPMVIWEADLPLLSRRGLFYWSVTVLAGAGIMAGLLAVVFATGGEWDALPPMLAIVAAVASGLWALGLAIMVVVFRGRYHVRYTISARGIRCEDVSGAAGTTNRTADLAGVATRRPHLVGAGLIAASRGFESLRWSGAFRAVFDARHHQVVLCNAWRTLMWVQCTPDNYGEVASLIESQMRRRGTTGRVGSSPLPSYLGRTALVAAAAMPMLRLAVEFETGLLLPIVIFCFALAMVWILNLFGWVVIAGLVVQAVLTAGSLLTPYESGLRPGTFFRNYQVLDSADLALLSAAAFGGAAVGWLAVRAIRGRWLAALVDGAVDA